MSNAGPAHLVEPQPAPEPRRSRWRLVFRVRTLMVLVAVVAALLWAWPEYKRHQAVWQLMEHVEVGLAASNSTAIKQAIRRVHDLHADHLAVSSLRAVLEEALGEGDFQFDVDGDQDAVRFKRKMAALQILNWIGPSAAEATPTLAKMLTQEHSPMLRRGAMRSLHWYGQPRPFVITALAQGLNDPFAENAEGAARELHEFGAFAEPAIPALVQALRHPNAAVRCTVAEALGRIHREPERTVNGLIEATRDSDRDVRRKAIEALFYFENDHPRIVPCWVAALGDKEPLIRGGAAYQLSDPGAPALPALPALEAAAENEKDENIKAQMLAAIATLRVRQNTNRPESTETAQTTAQPAP